MVEEVQAQLEAIYGVQPDAEARAADFLVDPEQARALGAKGHASEELLVADDGAGADLEVALYLKPQLLDEVRTMRPDLPGVLDGKGLDAFCVLTEGVSHFLYLSRAAAQERRITLLELEAQAEVDKFALCLLLRWYEVTWGAQLHRRLFDEVTFRPHLSGPELQRYGEANRLARTYCLGLLSFVAARRLDRLLGELRYMYRLGAEAKLRHWSLRWGRGFTR